MSALDETAQNTDTQHINRHRCYSHLVKAFACDKTNTSLSIASVRNQRPEATQAAFRRTG